jgi:hypothetical protein
MKEALKADVKQRLAELDEIYQEEDKAEKKAKRKEELKESYEENKKEINDERQRLN